MKRLTSIFLIAALLGPNGWLMGQTVKPRAAADGQAEKSYQLSYRGTTLDQVLEVVRKITGRTIIVDPKVSPITINLVSEERLSETDTLIAIETYLEMNNIVLVPQGDKFIQVVTAETAFQRPLKPNYEDITDLDANDESRLVSQVISLKYVTLEEVQPVLTLMLHGFAKVQFLERANSILIVDTAYNVKRVMDMLKYVDRPNIRTEEPKIYQIKHAQATEVAAKLTELIAESQAEADANANRRTLTPTRTTPTTPTRTAPAGVIRARTTPTPATPTSASFGGQTSDAEKGLISGKVQIVPDERTNIIIIISRAENFPFFDQMIEVLDVKVEPEITFQNVRLEFAIAEDVASLINELIGAASAGDSAGRTSGAAATGAGGNDANAGSTQARSIRDFIQSRNSASNANRSSSNANSRENNGEASLGEISETTQVIADPRTNSIMIMGRKQDIEMLSAVIKEVDIMLDQVLIEAVILEVGLNNNISYGVDWLQRSLSVVDQQRIGPRGGITTADDIAAFGSASRQGNSSFIDGATVGRDTEFPDGALSIFGTYYDLNLDVVMTLAAGDSDARVLSTPVILTTDNTEANIIVGERRPIPTSTSSGINTGVNQTNVDYENIGIELKVTPRINPQGFVVMEIEQSADNVGGNVVISGDEFPIITTRQLNGSIAVQDRQTIVLGGLVSEDKRDSTTKVPIIGDMPLIGSLFRNQSNSKNRTELLVLITPYVVGSTLDAHTETSRLKNATKLGDETWHRQWSDSPLNPDKDAEVPISRFRDQLKRTKKQDAPSFQPVGVEPPADEVELPAPKQVQETSRFQRPLLKVIEKPELPEATPEANVAEGNWKITPGEEDQVAPALKVLPIPEATPAPVVERPRIPAPKIPAPRPAAPRAIPAPAIPTPAVPAPTSGTPASSATTPAIPTPAAVAAPAVPAATAAPQTPREKFIASRKAMQQVAPRPAAVPSLDTRSTSLANNPAVKRVTPPVVSPQPAAIPVTPPTRNLKPPVKPVAPAPAPAAAPKTTTVAPPVSKPAAAPTLAKPLPPPQAMQQKTSGQRLILNSGKETEAPPVWRKLKPNTDKAPAVGDPVPDKDSTSQNEKKPLRLRNLFGSLR